MPDYTSKNFCPIEQEIRDSSVLLALQRMIGDFPSVCHYTFDDVPNQNETYYLLRYWITNTEKNILVGAGIVGTDTLMTHHLIISVFPTFHQAIFLTEDTFEDDPPA